MYVLKSGYKNVQNIKINFFNLPVICLCKTVLLIHIHLDFNLIFPRLK